ncbi:MAG: ribosomal protein S18-alanine N-acetyltransferase [Nitrososphaerales archaeon]
MLEEEIHIREFKLSDLSQLIKIERECFKDPYDRFTFFILHELYPRGFLVAELNGRVIGYVSLLKFRKKASIISMAVLKEFRRKGIGEKMLTQAIEKVKGKVKEISLEVRVSNYPAINLYKKMGFKEIKVIKSYYLDGEDALKMKVSFEKNK